MTYPTEAQIEAFLTEYSLWFIRESELPQGYKGMRLYDICRHDDGLVVDPVIKKGPIEAMEWDAEFQMRSMACRAALIAADKAAINSPARALANLRFFRPGVFEASETFEQKIKELNATGDTRVVYVSEGDWIMVEWAMMELRPLPTPPEGE